MVLGAVLVAVHHAHDIAAGVILQFLRRPATGLDLRAVAAQVIEEFRTTLESIQLLEQAAFFIIGVGLKHMAIWPHHCEHTALVVIGVLISRSIVRLWVVLVGVQHLRQIAVAVMAVAGYAIKMVNFT